MSIMTGGCYLGGGGGCTSDKNNSVSEPADTKIKLTMASYKPTSGFKITFRKHAKFCRLFFSSPNFLPAIFEAIKCMCVCFIAIHGYISAN